MNTMIHAAGPKSVRRHVSTDIRRGMWVIEDGQVAICNALMVKEDDGYLRAANRFDEEVTHAELHFVDDRGDTRLVAILPIGGVTQAPRAAIPERRRPPAVLAVRAMGYE